MPAGNLGILKAAVMFGADAVYIGGDMYGLRAKAHNFSTNEMSEGIAFAPQLRKKVYVTANITAHNNDLLGVREYFKELSVIKRMRLLYQTRVYLWLLKKYALI